jgi:two-component system, OmpR family, alkaline phosphatase synthesis response regulator PhoP
MDAARRSTKSVASVLIVDDEDDILELIGYNFQREGYSVRTARDGVEALDFARSDTPDLIILDIMMPRMDGIETCRRIRADSALEAVPVLMLTARTEEEHQVEGLDVGADIYLSKPVSSPVLLSQSRALLRGAGRNQTQPEKLVVHDLEVNRGRYLVERQNADGSSEEIRLPRKEFELLYYLGCHPGRVFSRQDLLDEVWGRDVYVVDRTVDVHVRKIREKLGSEYIETVKGVGYKFAERL